MEWDRASDISGKDGAIIRALRLISGCSVPFMHQGKKTTVTDELTLRSTYESQRPLWYHLKTSSSPEGIGQTIVKFSPRTWGSDEQLYKDV